MRGSILQSCEESWSFIGEVLTELPVFCFQFVENDLLSNKSSELISELLKQVSGSPCCHGETDLNCQ